MRKEREEGRAGGEVGEVGSENRTAAGRGSKGRLLCKARRAASVGS